MDVFLVGLFADQLSYPLRPIAQGNAIPPEHYWACRSLIWLWAICRSNVHTSIALDLQKDFWILQMRICVANKRANLRMYICRANLAGLIWEVPGLSPSMNRDYQTVLISFCCSLIMDNLLTHNKPKHPILQILLRVLQIDWAASAKCS